MILAWDKATADEDDSVIFLERALGLDLLPFIAFMVYRLKSLNYSSSEITPYLSHDESLTSRQPSPL